MEYSLFQVVFPASKVYNYYNKFKGMITMQKEINVRELKDNFVKILQKNIPAVIRSLQRRSLPLTISPLRFPTASLSDFSARPDAVKAQRLTLFPALQSLPRVKYSSVKTRLPTLSPRCAVLVLFSRITRFILT